MRTIAIGLLGAGNVGQGVLRILTENADAIEGRLGAQLDVAGVLVRDLDKPRSVPVPPDLLTDDPQRILGDPSVRVVVELLGGIEPARSLVLDAIARGKHVVTANKALLATCGREIFAAAAAQGVSVYFEGSVAGGVPILRTLREGLASDRILGICGIVNGTCNFVLDAMGRHGLDYAAAVAEAQDAGYAEADPSLDVEGIDAAQKLALLCLVSFGLRVDPRRIPTEGITRVRAFDLQTAERLGYVVKLLALAEATESGVRARVHPALVPRDSVFAGVHGPFNAVLVNSAALGRSLYYGLGAGMMPTGMAVVSDVVEVCRNVLAFADAGPPPEAFREVRDAEPLPIDEVEHENYLCVHVPNVPGVLGRVASCLGRHGVSIKRMNQDTPGPGEPIDMVILTERVAEARIAAALAEVDRFDDVLGPTDRIRIVDPDAVGGVP
ncbi:MAG: homoserine dehydrogenase [Deltaproteobacteria bacterium]|nr:MAG: homoserine dehydrogenase [Deltaproteobacteria bacterium]